MIGRPPAARRPGPRRPNMGPLLLPSHVPDGFSGKAPVTIVIDAAVLVFGSVGAAAPRWYGNP